MHAPSSTTRYENKLLFAVKKFCDIIDKVDCLNLINKVDCLNLSYRRYCTRVLYSQRETKDRTTLKQENVECQVYMSSCKALRSGIRAYQV